MAAFRYLRVRRDAKALAVEIHGITQQGPLTGDYGLGIKFEERR